MLLLRRWPGDRELGRAQLDDAIAAAQRYGAHGLERRVQARRDRAQRRRPPTPPLAHPTERVNP